MLYIRCKITFAYLKKKKVNYVFFLYLCFCNFVLIFVSTGNDSIFRYQLLQYQRF